MSFGRGANPLVSILLPLPPAPFLVTLFFLMSFSLQEETLLSRTYSRSIRPSLTIYPRALRNNNCIIHPFSDAPPSLWIISPNTSLVGSMESRRMKINFFKAQSPPPHQHWPKRAPPPSSPALQLPGAVFCAPFWPPRTGAWVPCAVRFTANDFLHCSLCFFFFFLLFL